MRFASPQRCTLLFVLAITACGRDPVEVRNVSESLAQQASRANQPPVIESLRFDPAEPRMGDDVRAEVEISDPDGDPVRATYEWTLDGVAAGAGARRLVLGDSPRGTRFSVIVVASDGRDQSSPLTFAGTIQNTPPWIERLRIEPGDELTAGYPIRIEADSRDPDGDEITLSYTWKLNDLIETDRGDADSFSTAGLAPGDVVQVEVLARDAFGAGESFASPPLRITNRPPRVVSRPGAAVAGSFHYQIDVRDPDGDRIAYELEQSPEGMQIEPGSGDIQWQPSSSQGGLHPVRVIVDDLRGGRIAHDFELRVDTPPALPAKGTREAL